MVGHRLDSAPGQEGFVHGLIGQTNGDTLDGVGSQLRHLVGLLRCVTRSRLPWAVGSKRSRKRMGALPDEGRMADATRDVETLAEGRLRLRQLTGTPAIPPRRRCAPAMYF